MIQTCVTKYGRWLWPSRPYNDERGLARSEFPLREVDLLLLVVSSDCLLQRVLRIIYRLGAFHNHSADAAISAAFLPTIGNIPSATPLI